MFLIGVLWKISKNAYASSLIPIETHGLIPMVTG